MLQAATTITSRDVIVTENQVRIISDDSAFYYCAPYSSKRFVNVYKFRVHVYKITQ